MAIDAKVSFMGQVERKCADVLTVSEMEKTLQIISDLLEGFDMRECAGWKDEQKDDLMDAFLSTMAIQGRSVKTIERYKYQLGRFMEAVKTTTRKITVYHIRSVPGRLV